MTNTAATPAPHTAVAEALSGSRFASAQVSPTVDSWDGTQYVQVRWRWEDAERAALVKHLRAAGFDRVRDRVENITIWFGTPTV